MPIASASFLIVFATLAGSTDLTQPHGGGRPQITANPGSPEGPSPKRDPSGWLKTCAPDVDMCDQVADACLADGLDPELCEGFRVNICPQARAMSCKAIAAVCESEGVGCENVAATCKEQLDGCGPSSCHEAGALTDGEAIATCFAYPSRLGVCDGEPASSGHCLSLLTWDGCAISTCEWIACQEELEALGPLCPKAMPLACAPVMACDAAEQNDADGSCCSEFGHVDGKPDTCNESAGSFCVGCSYEPVLCMTHGCSVPGEEDCCLSPEGETVPC